MRKTVTSVSTDVGDLRAIVRHPDADPGRPLPGVVLVDAMAGR